MWRAATEALKSLISGHVVRCVANGNVTYGRKVAKCYADDYLATQEQARAAKRGIWAGDHQVAWEYRNGNKAQTRTYANAQNCTIKGNISSNGKIYHTPNSRWYKQTKITSAKGERWFCTEVEAKEAGFRKPRR